MADPLSITASVIAVASLAYSSSRVLFETISGIQDAPETLDHLRTDVGILYETIHHLHQWLAGGERTDATLSQAQKSNLCEIEPSLVACRIACDAFKAKIDRLLRHSMDGRVSLLDKIKTHFQEKEIKTKIEDAAARLTGQMQGLQIGLQAILDADSGGEGLFHLTKAQACMAALQDTTKATGHDYKYVKASKQARLLMGDLGNVQGAALHKFSNIEVEGGWVVAGNMAGDSAKDFFK
ncbi:hypothetical protein ZTR_03996 [Talaromyces verruculosus]|nr:hypothetical protein ZTR_03996 [Talaromyces verruculosus]